MPFLSVGAEFPYAFALSDISSMLSHFKERASPKNAMRLQSLLSHPDQVFFLVTSSLATSSPCVDHPSLSL